MLTINPKITDSNVRLFVLILTGVKSYFYTLFTHAPTNTGNCAFSKNWHFVNLIYRQVDLFHSFFYIQTICFFSFFYLFYFHLINLFLSALIKTYNYSKYLFYLPNYAKPTTTFKKT